MPTYSLSDPNPSKSSKSVFFRKPWLGVILLAALTLPVNAETWRARLLGQWVSTSYDALGGTELDSGYGGYLGLERRINDRWGLELGVGFAEVEASETNDSGLGRFSFRSELEASLQWVPLTLAANIHLNPEGPADFYLAPRIGWAMIDDLEISSRISFGGGFGIPGFALPGFDREISAEFETEDTFIYGLRAGLDWPIGDEGWHLSGTVDYMVMEFDLLDGFESEADPLSLGFGVSKSW